MAAISTSPAHLHRRLRAEHRGKDIRIPLLVSVFVGPALAATSLSLAGAQELTVFVRVETGEVLFFNPTDTAIEIAGYSIESPSESLAPEGWTPVAGRLDAAGDASFDASNSWLLLSGVDDASEFTEVVFFGAGGALDPGEFLSLGLGWDTGGGADLTATLLADEVVVSPEVVFSPLGDYDIDGDVDAADYTLFRDTFASTTDLRADGNQDGVVSVADYTIWRDAFIEIDPPTELISPSPEPSGAALAVAVLFYSPRRLRRVRKS